ncbi:MAG: hypothetical protein Q8O55_01380 [Dehalococcoidales bacterium]|nr:hypothetical protein [Dehalococcoidales bacterium]
MPLSKEEIVQIAKATAQEVINALHEDRLTYHEPETVRQGLQESLGEELTASMWYQLRARHARGRGDGETVKLYEHVAIEESRHYEEFNKRLIEVS